MNEQKYTYRVQWLVLVGAALFFLLLFGAWLTEGLNNEWRKAAKSLCRICWLRIILQARLRALQTSEKGIFQVELSHFKQGGPMYILPPGTGRSPDGGCSSTPHPASGDLANRSSC